MTGRARWLLFLTWFALVGAAVNGLLKGQYSVAFVAMGTLVLSSLPIFWGRLLHIRLPSGFVAAIAIFLYASLFLGESADFYGKYWWWDVVLHAGSAVGFGLIGVILMLLLLRGDKVSAAPITASFFAFCFAVTIGVLWEIFEFSMDQLFGFNMQKSGLIDTMWDLIVDCGGAAVGGIAGFLYWKGFKGGPLTATLREFAQKNRRLFRASGRIRD